MTCIAGIVQDGKVWMGADSAAVCDHDFSLITISARKVFHNGPFLIGLSGGIRAGQLLAHALDPPQCGPDDDIMAFMVTHFVDAVRVVLKDGGAARNKNEVEGLDGCFLVGYRGRLFRVDEDYQVHETSHGFHACGCGELIALGSLYSSSGRRPKQRIELALSAAESFSAGVRGPFHTEDI